MIKHRQTKIHDKVIIALISSRKYKFDAKYNRYSIYYKLTSQNDNDQLFQKKKKKE